MVNMLVGVHGPIAHAHEGSQLNQSNRAVSNNPFETQFFEKGKAGIQKTLFWNQEGNQ